MDIVRPVDPKDILEFPCGKLYFRGNKDINDYSEVVVHPFDTMDWHNKMDQVFSKQKVIEMPPAINLVKVED
jgi:hypothetical protein